MQPSKISIITASFRSAATIRDTLESVNIQTYPQIDHLIIDAASKDDTLKIVRECGKRVAQVISEPDKGIFDAPDATVSLAVDCTSPVLLHASVRNIGHASLPAAVDVALFKTVNGVETPVGQTTTTHALLPGQTEELVASIDAMKATSGDQFIARILNDPMKPRFHECRDDNNASAVAAAHCVQ